VKIQRQEQEKRILSTAVLSMRNINPFVGWVPIDEFEDLFINLTNGTLLAPSSQTIISRFLSKYRSRLQNPSHKMPNSSKVDLLLVVARSSTDLRMLESIPQWRQKFRYVTSFIINDYWKWYNTMIGVIVLRQY